MTDYSELVKALRCKRDDCEGCDLSFFDKDEGWMCQYVCTTNEAADAIEALQAYCEQLKTENTMLYNTITADRGVMFEWIQSLAQQLPKRGEWVDRYDEDDKPFFKRKYVCSACGHWNTYGKSNYCPKCGAKMEVQG